MKKDFAIQCFPGEIGNTLSVIDYADKIFSSVLFVISLYLSTGIADFIAVY